MPAYTNIPKPTGANYTNVAKPTGANYSNIAKRTGSQLIIRGMYMGPLGLTYSRNYITPPWLMVLKPQN